VGYGYERAAEEMERLGIAEIALFTGRERRLEPLG
jgi:hypothetical protein